MDLLETIKFLEDYYSFPSEDVSEMEVHFLLDKVKNAFSFREEELEKVLDNHPTYQLVRFSELQYYQLGEGTICGIEESNMYFCLVLPRVIANLYSDLWQGANLYHSWDQFEDDILQKKLEKEKSFKTKLVLDLIKRLEENGLGFVVSSLSQENSLKGYLGRKSKELVNKKHSVTRVGNFEKKEDGLVHFDVSIEELREVLVSLASEKFQAVKRVRDK